VKNSSVGQSFVTLQRPFPVINSFFPSFSFFSLEMNLCLFAGGKHGGHHSGGASADYCCFSHAFSFTGRAAFFPPMGRASSSPLISSLL